MCAYRNAESSASSSDRESKSGIGKTPFEMDIGNYRGYYKMRGGPSQDIVSRARVFLGGHDDVKLDVTFSNYDIASFTESS